VRDFYYDYRPVCNKGISKGRSMPKSKLTLKQTKFIAEYVKDGNATRAVREAYPNAKSEGAMRAMASENLTKPNIQKQIKVVLDEAGLTPELLIKELKKLIEGDDNSSKNKAIRTAAEIMGLIGSGVIANQINLAQGVTEEELEVGEMYKQWRAEQLRKENC